MPRRRFVSRSELNAERVFYFLLGVVLTFVAFVAHNYATG